MDQLPKGFEALMLRYGFSFAVVGDVTTGEKKCVGDRSLLEMDYILRNTFDSMAIKDLNECYKNRLFPVMLQQGAVCGLVCKPRENLVVGLFGNDRRGAMDRYDQDVRADQELRDLWKETE